ncbi:MAG: ABC transporter ATP-binding protein [Ardenticatenaceae bacterium]|nr:ABC transporter ATP-binding protein [Anaerolineales bacterium]MCB8919920.1 ABC transporter ATP-binding protein [Ardenticatenaceae bacterium]
MIEVTNLSKRFGGLVAVDDLSFQVDAGQAVALWGANGAGKTTALRCLLGLIPFSGRVTITGRDVSKQGKAARRQLGFVPQELNFHDDLSVAETLTFYARLKKLPNGSDFSDLLARLELLPHLPKRVHDLSGGLKQRLALALALLADPPLLVLDEPTANLDIRAREDFLALLHELKTGGKTLLFSSHRLEEVTALADRVLLLEAGRLVVDAPPHELAQRLGWSSTLHIYLPEATIDPALAQLTACGLPVSRNGRGVRVQVAPGAKGQVLRVLHDAGIVIDDFSLE